MQIILYDGLTRGQIVSLIHRTHKKSCHGQLKESLRVFFQRLARSFVNGKFYTNKSLAYHLVQCHLKDKIQIVTIKGHSVGIECNRIEHLFKQVISEIQSNKTKQALEEEFKLKKTTHEIIQDAIKSGRIIPSEAFCKEE